MSNKKKTACIGKECVACGRCINECPIGALSVYKGMYATVDENKCIGCGKCVRVCPAGVIEFKAREAQTA
ncbi:MAG: 4Fe-4S dicluster domain-containing protein [Lachnospiraceae bacterium]